MSELPTTAELNEAVEDRDLPRFKALADHIPGGPPVRILSELLSTGVEHRNREMVEYALSMGVSDAAGFEMAAIEGDMTAIELFEKIRRDQDAETLRLAIEYEHPDVALWAVNAGAPDIVGALVMVARAGFEPLKLFIDRCTVQPRILLGALIAAGERLRLTDTSAVEYLRHRIRAAEHQIRAAEYLQHN